MRTGLQVDGLTQAAKSYMLAAATTAAERDRNRRLKAGRRLAANVIERLSKLASRPIQLTHGVASQEEEEVIVEAQEKNERVKNQIESALADLESEEQKERFEAFLAQYAPELLQTYRRVLIEAISRGREIVATLMFIEGDDYSAYSRPAIPQYTPGSVKGPIESAEDFFR
ncbi:hypothetical protein [Sorangium sp. So ce128]|uniref:hypothetical protein n=1 Tax=Sorangium sp. So ce128 TaxID=3133281 RepID=UPI003F62E658